MSVGVEWAVHCCTLLAALDEDQALTTARLAEYHGVPAPYLAKHLQALVRAGICASVPGPLGGFKLARAADKITVLDVTLAVDGDDSAFRCTEIRQRGPAAQYDPACYPTACGIARVMWQAEDAWRRELAAVSIADIAGSLPATVHPDHLAASDAWLTGVLASRGRARADRS